VDGTHGPRSRRNERCVEIFLRILLVSDMSLAGRLQVSELLKLMTRTNSKTPVNAEEKRRADELRKAVTCSMQYPLVHLCSTMWPCAVDQDIHPAIYTVIGAIRPGEMCRLESIMRRSPQSPQLCAIFPSNKISASGVRPANAVRPVLLARPPAY
jgi:hypothetical protein